MQLKFLFEAFRNRLKPVWGEREAQQIARIVLEETFRVGFEYILSNKTVKIDAAREKTLSDIMDRLFKNNKEIVLSITFFIRSLYGSQI